MSINPGMHQAHAVAIGFGTAKTGTEQIAVTFETDSGSRISWYGYFTDKAAEYAIKTLRTCGWQGDDPAEITVDDINDPVELDVQEEEDRNGNVKCKVAWVNKPGGAPPMKAPMPADKRKAFGAAWKAACAAVKPQPRAPKQAPRAAAQQAQQPAPKAPLFEDPGYDREGLDALGDDDGVPF